MIDYFALLDLERRPAIDEESLKKTYFHRTELLRLGQAEAELSLLSIWPSGSFRILLREFSTF